MYTPLISTIAKSQFKLSVAYRKRKQKCFADDRPGNRVVDVQPCIGIGGYCRLQKDGCDGGRFVGMCNNQYVANVKCCLRSNAKENKGLPCLNLVSLNSKPYKAAPFGQEPETNLIILLELSTICWFDSQCLQLLTRDSINIPVRWMLV